MFFVFLLASYYVPKMEEESKETETVGDGLNWGRLRNTPNETALNGSHA